RCSAAWSGRARRTLPTRSLLALVAERAQAVALLLRGRRRGRDARGAAAQLRVVGVELGGEARGELGLRAAQVAALRRVAGQVVERVPPVAAPEVLVRSGDPHAQPAPEGRGV